MLDTPETKSIIAVVDENPGLVLVDETKFVDLCAEMKREIEAHVPDLTTDKGRKAVASLAFKVTRTKTAIDAAGKKLNEEARAQINIIDGRRRVVRETLDALAEEIRRPLTEWEAKEAKREAIAKEIVAGLRQLATIAPGSTAADVEGLLGEVSAYELDAATLKDRLAEAQSLKGAACEALKAAIPRMRQEEADRAELERLRAEKAKAEAAAREAEERAQAERARAEAEERQRTAIAEAEKQAAERAVQAERERVEREARAKEAEAKREAEAEARRAADQKHRNAVMSNVRAALIEHAQIDGEAAARVLVAILGDMVPNVSIRF